MNTKLIFIIAIVIIVIISAFLMPSSDRNSTTQDQLSNGSTDILSDTPILSPSKARNFGQVPQLSLTDYDGNTIDLASFKGKPVVLNSWATWCPFCVEELPDFAAVQQELGDQVVIVAIARGESLEKSKNFTDGLGLSKDITFLLDPNDSFYKSIGGFSMPETIFVDANGNIRQHKRGPMDATEIKRRIEELLSI